MTWTKVSAGTTSSLSTSVSRWTRRNREHCKLKKQLLSIVNERLLDLPGHTREWTLMILMVMAVRLLRPRRKVGIRRRRGPRLLLALLPESRTLRRLSSSRVC